MRFLKKNLLLFWVLLCLIHSLFAQQTGEQRHYWDVVRPIFFKHCTSCHNSEDNKGGLNIESYDFIVKIKRDGERFEKIVHQISTREMPPEIRPPMTQDEIDTVTTYINKYLQDALAEKDPGNVFPRRLNNREYRYTMLDLLGIEVNTDSLFPSDPSGGAGFDNQARVLYLMPLLMERYYEAAEYVVDQLHADSLKWAQVVKPYDNSNWEQFRIWWHGWWNDEDVSLEAPQEAARATLFPLATRAYRRFLNASEKQKLIDFFTEVYTDQDDQPDRYEQAIKETLKLIFISHHFLYRTEADPDIAGAYRISNFELASRLSFFLWSSIPDETLLEVAYRENLHHPEILEAQVTRMLADPKAERLGEAFALQWLELTKLKDPAFQLDPEKYPDYNPVLRDIMLEEVSSFFNYVMLNSQNFLDLIDSDYAFVNQSLAKHYGLSGVKGDDIQMVCLDEGERGGLLGTAGVLTATSLPTRTSPVIRGKWVLEQILGTPANPPPADVPELEASQNIHDEMSLRELLMVHREDPACAGCHEDMDPLGLGLENFDGMGRWRDKYEKHPIDASGTLSTGEFFNGPSELKRILLGKKDLFAKNLSKKMLSFALGRSLQFKDTPTTKHLTKTLMETDFHTTTFVRELVLSFPFTHKKSDNPKPEI